MSNFTVAINVVMPLVILIALGYYAKESKLVSKDAFKQMNQLVFKFLIPTSLLKSIIETDLSVAFQPKLIIYALGCILVMIVLLWLIVPRFEHDKKRIGVIIQAIYRSNFVLFGLSIVSNMYGSDNVGITSVLIAFCVPLYNILAVIVLQYYGMNEVDFKSVFKGILKNPMIIGTLIGFIILIFDIQLPTFAKNSISDIAKMATPLALVVLGGTFEFQSITKNLRPLTIITICRLFVVPACFVGLVAFIGYRQVELFSLLALFGSPVAVASYAMAQSMNCDEELASQAVLMTTICSIISMLFWITLLNSLGLL